MKQETGVPPQIIYTIGHSNKSIREFLKKLKEWDIELVVDVRSKPFSSWSPHFNRPRLEKSLLDVGIEYLFKGNNLGGLGENTHFQKAVNEVFELSGNTALVLMCSEGNYEKCHRNTMLAPVFIEKGAIIKHIDWKNVNENKTDRGSLFQSF